MKNNPRENLIRDCSFTKLDKLPDEKGNLVVIESNLYIPFAVERIFHIYDIPEGESRGAHAHKKCHQFIIAASGAFEVALDDGKSKKTVALNRPHYGLHIPPGIWAAEQRFSFNSVCLVLASHKFDKEDYISEYEEFLEWKRKTYQDIDTFI
jgi:hypothetical protein